MNSAIILLLLASTSTVIYGQWILNKIVEGPIARNDDYWVIKINGIATKPPFPAYIRFYNTHEPKPELEIECSKSDQILYYGDEIIFRTKGHLWTVGDTYYITLDEGVLYSTEITNSTDYLDPKFWQFNVIAPKDTF